VNVLIVNTNRYCNPVPVIPLGSCLVAESIEKAGYHVRFLDLLFEHDPVCALESELSKATPDVVGLSVRNIDNNDMQHPMAFFSDLVPMVKLVRSRTQAIIVLGGAAVGVMPEELLRYTGTDYTVIGDGEIVFPGLLETFSSGGVVECIDGIAWLGNGVFKSNTNYVSRFSDGCSVPDFSRWICIKDYLTRLSTVPIQTKLGCHFRCVYCTYRKIEGHDYRLCNSDSVVDAIVYLAKKGLRDIEFVDNVFNSPYEHAMAVCEGIARVQPQVRLQSIELNPLFVDDNLLTAMERAGFVAIGITVESASDVVLKKLNKGFTANDVYNAAHVVRRHRMPCIWIFMLGGPGETEETVCETLQFAERCIRPGDAAFFNIGVRIYPGTELENIARKEGILILSPQEMLEPVFYISPALDYEWLTNTVRVALAQHMNYIGSDAIGLSLLPKLNRLAYKLGVRPPLWKHSRSVRRTLRFLGMNM